MIMVRVMMIIAIMMITMIKIIVMIMKVVRIIIVIIFAIIMTVIIVIIIINYHRDYDNCHDHVRNDDDKLAQTVAGWQAACEDRQKF